MTFDAATDGGNNGGGSTSLTFSHTVTGSDPILFVGFVGDLIANPDLITGVTYNGVAMTQVRASNLSGCERWVYLYGLTAPATGSHSVVITSSGVQWVLAGAASYTGASAVRNSTNSTSGTPATTWTTFLTPDTDACWMVLMEHARGASPTAGAGSTLRAVDAANATWGLFDSNGPITPPSSYSMTTNRASATFATGHIPAAFEPSAPPTPGAIVFNLQVG